MSSRMGWAASMVGRTLDAQYRVDGILGEGAMGVVFRGVNLAMDKPVAIKMMRKDTFDTPDAVERFKREARVWSQLNHPAITQVFDFGIQDGMPFLVMELVEGADLSEVLKQETRIKPMRAVALMRQLAAALCLGALGTAVRCAGDAAAAAAVRLAGRRAHGGRTRPGAGGGGRRSGGGR